MNKEEILKRNEELYNDFYERTKNYGRNQFVKFILAEEEEKRLLNNKNTKLFNINKKLEQENKELHNKIGKAIEYINKNSIYFATSEKVGNYFSNCNCDDLLEILKDGDTNE